MFRGWELKNRLQRSCSTNADFGVAELERLRTQAQFKLGRQGDWKENWTVPDTQVPPADDVGGEHCHGSVSDTDPRLSCGGAVGTQVDSSDVPSEFLDAMERDCEASHSGPHNADVTAPGRSMLVSTQVDSDDEFASQLQFKMIPEPEIMVGFPFSPMISHNPD